jgi:hypothetical protein
VEQTIKQLSLGKLVCTRLETKCNPYASFHVSVVEDELPLIHSSDVWPSRSLMAPHYGKLTPHQVYSPSTPVKITNAGAPTTAGTSNAIKSCEQE